MFLYRADLQLVASATAVLKRTVPVSPSGFTPVFI